MFMVKSNSVLIIGTGIFIFYVFFIMSAVTPAYDDYLLQNEISNLKFSQYIAEYDQGIDTLLYIIVGYGGLGLGILLLIIGGVKVLSNKRKSQEIIVEEKQVNLVWQVIGSLFPGFDLWVMYRIKKLRLASIVYSITIVSQVLYMLGMPEGNFNDWYFFTIGYAVIVFIWSRQWNKHLDGGDTEQIPTKGWDN